MPPEWGVRCKKAPEFEFKAGCARAHHTLVEYKNELWLFGGTEVESHGRPQNAVWKYNLEKSRWSMVEVEGKLPPRREGHTAVVHKRAMYVFGGHKGLSFAADFIKFDFGSLTWSKVNDGVHSRPAAPRFGHAAVVASERMWVVGGFLREVPPALMAAYSFTRDAWIHHEDPPGISPHLHTQPAVAAFGSSLYVFGIFPDAARSLDVAVYDTAAERWRVTAPAGPVPRPAWACATGSRLAAPVHAARRGAVLFFRGKRQVRRPSAGGGGPAEAPTPEIVGFDLVSERWEMLPVGGTPFPTVSPPSEYEVRYRTVCLSGDRILVCGGVSPAEHTMTSLQFVPADEVHRAAPASPPRGRRRAAKKRHVPRTVPPVSVTPAAAGAVAVLGATDRGPPEPSGFSPLQIGSLRFGSPLARAPRRPAGSGGTEAGQRTPPPFALSLRPPSCRTLPPSCSSVSSVPIEGDTPQPQHPEFRPTQRSSDCTSPRGSAGPPGRLRADVCLVPFVKELSIPACLSPKTANAPVVRLKTTDDEKAWQDTVYKAQLQFLFEANEACRQDELRRKDVARVIAAKEDRLNLRVELADRKPKVDRKQTTMLPGHAPSPYDADADLLEWKMGCDVIVKRSDVHLQGDPEPLPAQETLASSSSPRLKRLVLGAKLAGKMTGCSPTAEFVPAPTRSLCDGFHFRRSRVVLRNILAELDACSVSQLLLPSQSQKEGTAS
ncbi:Actin-fragmin kinase [Diplonema papillatum]|nr:Actin-fragmin kinase [Diplonema papillatum]KAJ9464375.1 Actin-fragmin kinase [Diplonema papillatum]